MRRRNIWVRAATSLSCLAPAAVLADGLEDVMAAVVGPDVVIVGEVHDNPRHHAIQRDVATRLSPTAIVFEMFPSARDDDLNAARQSGATRAELNNLLAWEDSGWPSFQYYAEIMEAAPGAAIFGAEQPRGTARKAFEQGAAAVFDGDAARFGLTRELAPAEHDARLALQDAAHCGAMPKEMLPGMVEAQRLRDASLADATLRALAEHGPPVLVITGNGHARTDWGMPVLIEHAAPGTSLIAVGQLEAAPAMAVPYDIWVTSPPVERDDPCAAFTKP